MAEVIQPSTPAAPPSEWRLRDDWEYFEMAPLLDNRWWVPVWEQSSTALERERESFPRVLWTFVQAVLVLSFFVGFMALFNGCTYC